MRYQVTKGDGVPGEERHAHAPGSTQQQQHPMEAKNVPECRMMEKESDREMNRMDNLQSSSIVSGNMHRKNYAVAKNSDTPMWESQPARSLIATHVNTPLVPLASNYYLNCAFIPECVCAN